jgi:hypothetical protein
MEEVKKVRVFVASPGDVKVERDALAGVVDDINWTLATLAPEKGVVLELIRWETHVAPGIGRDAQDVVNRQIGDYDIFVGIMWKRFGTPTAVAGSGTDEEFQRAYDRWQENPSLPIMFYFSQAPTSPKSKEEITQLAKVIEFRDELVGKGALVAEYPGPDGFADTIRRGLTLTIAQMFSSATPSEAAERAGQRSDSNLDGVRMYLRELADEYEGLRRTMPSGDERTRRMANVHARLRALARDAYPLLPELTKSASAGERLAAVAILQEIPSKDYVRWLAERVGPEKPFVVYQATRALLSASQLLGPTSPDEVAHAIEAAQEAMGHLARQDPSQVSVLESARRVIDQYRRARP